MRSFPYMETSSLTILLLLDIEFILSEVYYENLLFGALPWILLKNSPRTAIAGSNILDFNSYGHNLK